MLVTTKCLQGIEEFAGLNVPESKTFVIELGVRKNVVLRVPPNWLDSSTDEDLVWVVMNVATGHPEMVGTYWTNGVVDPKVKTITERTRKLHKEDILNSLFAISCNYKSTLMYGAVYVGTDAPLATPIVYGVACAKCKEYCQHAIAIPGFKCYGCKRG